MMAVTTVPHSHSHPHFLSFPFSLSFAFSSSSLQHLSIPWTTDVAAGLLWPGVFVAPAGPLLPLLPESANALPKASLVYDADAATETRYLNASNMELACRLDANSNSKNALDSESEKKSHRKLLQFTFQELKLATGNFRPDSILGECGFGYVFKGWIEENNISPVKPETSVTVAVKSLKLDALQGHMEWVVSTLVSTLISKVMVQLHKWIQRSHSQCIMAAPRIINIDVQN